MPSAHQPRPASGGAPSPNKRPYKAPTLTRLGSLGRVVKQSGTVTVTGGRT